jgi:hypothetical protein
MSVAGEDMVDVVAAGVDGGVVVALTTASERFLIFHDFLL